MSVREKVLAYKVKITRKGERRFFEIKLPHDAREIIGLEITIKK